jgi:hypothetical protein
VRSLIAQSGKWLDGGLISEVDDNLLDYSEQTDFDMHTAFHPNWSVLDVFSFSDGKRAERRSYQLHSEASFGLKMCPVLRSPLCKVSLLMPKATRANFCMSIMKLLYMY